ncbi:MAG TPA: hypothetical protein VKR82_04385 [Candidatus Acidoferrales bacterium]|nr:hypothetical protein [Candidatus Acidoferrales bacterium]
MRRALASILLTTLIATSSLRGDAGNVVFGSASSKMDVGAEPLEALVLARNTVETMFKRSENVVCLESVTQTIVGKSDHPVYREETKYEYQMQTSFVNGTLKLQEARDASKQPFRDPARTLLITSGFAAMLLIVHSNYESSYQFEPAGEETNENGTLVKLQYTPVPGATSPAALRLRGKNYALPLSGTMWIDKQSGAVVRLTAAVDSSLSDLGLKGMTSDIHYALVQFHDPDESYWMPVSATIDVETPKQHWRNIHRFTAYRRFTGKILVEPASKP